MKSVKINVPEGYEIDKEKSTFETIVFKETPPQNPTWKEIQKQNFENEKTQYFLDGHGVIKECLSSPLVTLGITPTHLPDEKTAESIRALCQLHIIAEYYNDGWKPKQDTYQCYPVYNIGTNTMDSIRWHELSMSCIPAFKDIDTLQRAYKANKEIFETALKP